MLFLLDISQLWSVIIVLSCDVSNPQYVTIEWQDIFIHRRSNLIVSVKHHYLFLIDDQPLIKGSATIVIGKLVTPGEFMSIGVLGHDLWELLDLVEPPCKHFMRVS